MGWIEFFSHVIDNVLSWPVAIVVTVLILRKQLQDLFRTIENFVLRGAGWEVSFNRRLEKARENIAEVVKPSEIEPTNLQPLPGKTGKRREPKEEDEAPRPPTREAPDEDLNSSYLALINRVALSSPTQVILDAWYRIAYEVHQLAKAVDPDQVKVVTPTLLDPMQTLVELADADIVPASLVAAVKHLHQLRNEVVHRSGADEKLSTEQVIAYITTASEIIDFLRQTRRRLRSS
jgi:hypothetical protein